MVTSPRILIALCTFALGVAVSVAVNYEPPRLEAVRIGALKAPLKCSILRAGTVTKEGEQTIVSGWHFDCSATGSIDLLGGYTLEELELISFQHHAKHFTFDKLIIRRNAFDGGEQ